MTTDIRARLDSMAADKMLRRIPDDRPDGILTDFSTNDYLGLAADSSLHDRFLGESDNLHIPFTSSASRLLASRQSAYSALEATLDSHYPGRRSLLFNSGYHANTGLVATLTSLYERPLIIADKLVHASIIDGIILSRADFRRFPHNNLDSLEQMLSRTASRSDRPDGVIIIVESVYSMDGDRADIDRLADIKRRFSRDGMEIVLYVDEAHAVGVEGPSGLGLVEGSADPLAADVVVGTLGKALASSGAFALMSADLREWAVNRSRSFIFSTSLPPIVAAWSRFMFEKAVEADDRREKLRTLTSILDPIDRRYIYPAITGSAESALALSDRLLDDLNIKVLPIRTPTVPIGTERLRISLSSAHDEADVIRLRQFLDTALPR